MKYYHNLESYSKQSSGQYKTSILIYNYRAFLRLATGLPQIMPRTVFSRYELVDKTF